MKIQLKKLLILPLLIFCASVLAQLEKPNGLKVGDEAPQFSAVNVVDGDEVELASYLERGPVLLVFYRGEWCKYCNKHLSDLADWQEEIETAGITIMTFSPQTEENVQKTIGHTDASFLMFSDNDFKIMKAYDVDFTLDQKTLDKYKKWDIDIDKANGDRSNTMTVPATYLIGTDGKIVYVHFDEDYKERSLPEMIMESYWESTEGTEKQEAKRKDARDNRRGR